MKAALLALLAACGEDQSCELEDVVRSAVGTMDVTDCGSFAFVDDLPSSPDFAAGRACAVMAAAEKRPFELHYYREMDAEYLGRSIVGGVAPDGYRVHIIESDYNAHDRPGIALLTKHESCSSLQDYQPAGCEPLFTTRLCFSCGAMYRYEPDCIVED